MEPCIWRVPVEERVGQLKVLCRYFKFQPVLKSLKVCIFGEFKAVNDPNLLSFVQSFGILLDPEHCKISVEMKEKARLEEGEEDNSSANWVVFNQEESDLGEPSDLALELESQQARV